MLETTRDDAATDDDSEPVDASGRPRLGLLQLEPARRPPPGWSNPDGDGGIVVPHPDDEYCYGVNHSWEAEHDDWDNGMNDHFVTPNNPDGAADVLLRGRHRHPVLLRAREHVLRRRPLLLLGPELHVAQPLLPHGGDLLRHRRQLGLHARHR